jgi:UDP-N-acetylmuramate--alanine ligase
VADIREGLRDFTGIRRRFEVVGSWRGATLVDDYAHHPTAISATLRTAREVFDARRIWCVFQPHQVSRTRALMDDFAASFGAADEVLIAPVYGAREQYQSELGECSQILAERIAGHGRSARLISTLEDEVQPGHVLVTMGAGDIDQVHYAFTRRLQRHYPPR